MTMMTTRDPPGAAAVDRDLLLLLIGLSFSQSCKTGLCFIENAPLACQ